jgi:hypothetical protein
MPASCIAVQASGQWRQHVTPKHLHAVNVRREFRARKNVVVTARRPIAALDRMREPFPRHRVHRRGQSQARAVGQSLNRLLAARRRHGDVFIHVAGHEPLVIFRFQSRAGS